MKATSQTLVLALAMVFVGAPTWAQDVPAPGTRAAAAGAIANLLVEGWVREHGSAQATMLVDDVQGGGEAAAFRRDLADALSARGVRVLDRQALKASLDEAALAAAAGTDLAEMAAALGAQALVLIAVDGAEGSHNATARLVRTADGTLAASATARFGDEEETSPTAQSLDMAMRRLADRLVAGMGQLGDARYRRFAVLPFEEVGATTADLQLGLLVTAELTTALYRDHRLLLVERAALTRVIDELALAQTGLVDPGQAAEVGRLAGADGLVIGQVAEAGDTYRVHARVVDAQTGTVVAADEVMLVAANLVALSAEAVVLRTRSGAVFRSLLVPGWGQFYNREPIKGIVLASVEGAAVALALTFHFLGAAAEDRYRGLGASATPEMFDQAVRERRDDWRIRNGFLIGAIAVHALNVIDAAVFGKTFDSASPSASGAGGAVGWGWRF